MFISTTAVFLAELVKLVTCLGLVWNSEDRDVGRWWNSLHSTIIKQPLDTVKVMVPSGVYLIQNNLLYVAASNLDVATYQITYQLKILTTAMFAVTMMGKKLLPTQWLSLLTLVAGVAMVQLSDVKESASAGPEQSKVVGFTAALTACMLSGFAKDGGKISESGFLHGYDSFVWFTVAQNALGGLLVAVVVKYADNILKGFACSLAIIITCVASIFIFDFTLSRPFSAGAFLVIGSIFLYGYQPPPTRPTEKV